MKIYTFPYYISFGKNDGVDCTIDCEINDKQAKRLERSAKEKACFRLDEEDDLHDVYNRVLQAILRHETELLVNDPSIVQDALSWRDDYDESAPVSIEQIREYVDELIIGINFPAELQMLEPSIKKRVRKVKCEQIVLSREEAAEYVKESPESNMIVYVDQGETLYYVPLKYSGVFTIPSNVTKIEKTAFYKRKGVTEVIIEEGLTEIPEWAFEDCDSLERVIVPSSVKRICFNAFTKCSKLSEVDLSEGLIEIDDTAFRFCYALEELHIPSTVKEIGAYINCYQNGLRRIYFEGMDTTIIGLDDDDWSRMTMHVRKGSCAEQIANERDIRHELYPIT